ncbi:MAG: hypothetical protein RL607_1110 [Bacteroidota bacterium]|jgi:arsenate reductase
MITIYHNPRCGKSRECLVHFENSNEPIKIVKYLEQPFTKAELKQLIKQLNCHPSELIRVKESLWISNYKGKTLTDDQLIETMVEHPILIERPIVVKGNQAVIARPLENINRLK